MALESLKPKNRSLSMVRSPFGHLIVAENRLPLHTNILFLEINGCCLPETNSLTHSTGKIPLLASGYMPTKAVAARIVHKRPT